jgi:hypothetical protein
MAELSSVDYAFLAILKAEDREISNSEMDQIYGFRLVGRPLQRLLADDYIVTNKEHAPYRHVIAQAGLDVLAEPWSVGDDHVEKGERRTTRERQLWAALVAFQRLQAGPAKRKPADLDGRIRMAYEKLAAGPGEWVSLAALRPLLADVPKAKLDAALNQMLRDEDVWLEPDQLEGRLSVEERKAAVDVGGESRHKLAIGRP